MTMSIKYFLAAVIILQSVAGFAQSGQTTNVLSSTDQNPRNEELKQAVEVESLFPMFFYGGFHYCVGYRYRNFRVRVSVINSGTMDVEPFGIHNSENRFKRFYKTSPGMFFGYEVWKNLELYTWVEDHTFQIEEKSTGQKQDLKSYDFGLGTSYQFFIGKVFYIEPGIHFYVRSSKEAVFPDAVYHISNFDVSPIIRIGFRLWEEH